MRFFTRMVQSLRSEAKRSEDIYMQLQEIQESARLAFLNCLLDFAGIINELVPSVFRILELQYLILIFIDQVI